MPREDQKNFIELYSDSIFAAALLDGKFNIIWKNERAEKVYPLSGASLRLPFTDHEDLERQLTLYGSITVRTEPFPESGQSAVFGLLGDGTISVVFASDGAPFLANPVILNGVDAFSYYVRSNVQSAAIHLEVLKNRQDDDPEANESMNELQRSNYKMLRMAGNMTTVSRFMSGSLTANRRLCDIVETVRAICDSIRSVVVSNIKFEYDLPKNGCNVMLDSELFANGLLNIILNAYKYTRDDNEIKLVLTVDASKVTIAIRDSGTGILPELLARVTEPYFSSDPYGEGERPGLGLGLAVASIASQMHGGVLLVNSEYGEGTSVVLTLSREIDDDFGEGFASTTAKYVTDRFSEVYVGLCEICEIP